MANPRQGDFAKPDWEMRRASGDSLTGSTSYPKKGSGLSRTDAREILLTWHPSVGSHNKKTVSDRYGGEKPNVLAKANEEICEFLTKDAEVKAAMLRLVC